MNSLPRETVQKLGKILAKRLGRELTLEELQEAYQNLMEFAYALTELESTPPPVSADTTFSAQHIANHAVSAV